MNKIELAIDAARNDDMERVIKLLEEALAEQAEQEPVAWIKLNEDGVYIEDVTGFPVYAAPVRTKDLTDDEIAAVTGYRKSGATWPVVKEVARAVIAKFKEKNK